MIRTKEFYWCMPGLLLLFSMAAIGQAELSVLDSGVGKDQVDETEIGSLAWEAIDQRFCYAGDDLGVRLDPQSGSVTFRLWAPGAERVELTIVDLEAGSKPIGSPIALTRESKTGTWRHDLNPVDLGVEQLVGLGYRYSIDGVEALDPYAQSLAVDEGELPTAAIVDPDSERVLRNASIPGYRTRTDAVIYALHLRDFSSYPELEAVLGPTRFGTFGALQKRLDYLVALGVTHINLAPVMAMAGGNEIAPDERESEWEPETVHAWGQSPQAYLAPDGWYSSDPEDPQARVDELKRLINAVHERGMGVILDVVFSQSPDTSLLEPVMPGYFYRDTAGELGRAELASERCMVRKLIRDTLVYWTREYGVDGFRFDRMGLLDARSLLAAHDAVAEINPQTLMFGEGEPLYQGEQVMQMADRSWMLAQNRVAVMSDGFRDQIKSGGAEEGKPRFVTGGSESVKSLLMNLQAQPLQPMRVDEPVDVVQYLVDRHGLTLHDAIANVLNVNPDRPAAQAEIQRRIRLANTLLLVSQGAVYLDAGQEYGRSRRWRGESPVPQLESNAAGVQFLLDGDSAPDVVNWFDWSAVTEAGVRAQTARYTAGLISLRRNSSAFRQGSREQIYRNVKAVSTPDIGPVDKAVAFEARDKNGARLLVFVNADTRERRFRLTERLNRVQVLVDSKRAGLSPISAPVDVILEDRAVRLAPLTATVLYLPDAYQ